MSPPSSPGHMAPFRRRRPVWVIGGLALVGLLIAGAFILRPSDARAIYRTAAVEQAMGESGRLVTRVPTAALGWTPTDAQSPSRFYSAARSSGGPGPRGSPSAQVAEVLDLDAAQQRVWKDLSLDLRRQITLLAAQAGGDRAAAIEGVVRATHEAFAKLEPSLRTDQKQKLASLRASMAAVGRPGSDGYDIGVVYVLRDGKPWAAPVRLGATDGSMTEVAGPLAAGERVIIGGSD